jgi:hypothetical protein
MIPIVGKLYTYTRDGRQVKVVQVIEKTLRVEIVDESGWNPFFVNFSELSELSFNELKESKLI